jgi:ABC-type uncharacterized transport system auxiliary subunit
MKRLAIMLVLAACANKVPDTRYYQLAAPTKAVTPGNAVLVLEPFETDTAYDDERIVYRTNPYRLDYYQYHRWSSSPGVLVGNFVEQALEHSGRFRAVVREATTDAAVSLHGRVVAIEEVDRSKTHWVGRIVLELSLMDARTGEVLWQDQFEEQEPMPLQHPEGLARALSTAMGRITAKAAPIVGDLADKRAAANATIAPAASARRRP